jgi:hypothetical protein
VICVPSTCRKLLTTTELLKIVPPGKRVINTEKSGILQRLCMTHRQAPRLTRARH